MPVLEGDVLKIASRGLIASAGQRAVNVFTVQASSIIDASDDTVRDELAAEMETLFNTIQVQISNDFQIVDFSITNQTQDLLLGEVPSTFIGADIADLIPSQVAALIIGRTAVKRKQGRKFLGGWTDTDNDDGGLWVGGAVTALNAFAARYVLPFTGPSTNIYTPGVSDRPVFPLPITFVPFTQGKLIPNSRTQRSRTKRFGFS